MLTEAEVDEFKKLVLEVYGIKLTEEQAQDQGSRLISLFELLLKAEKGKQRPTHKQQKVVQHNG